MCVEQRLARHDALPNFDVDRFRFLKVISQQERHTGQATGQIELYEDLRRGCKVVGKRMFASWTLSSPEAFERAHPELLESPWKELELSLYVKSVDLKGACKILGAYISQADLLILLEYIPGGDFHDLTQRLSFQNREALCWPAIRSLLQAVKAWHRCGLAHGDISLENALLTADGEVRLVDFAAAVKAHTAIGVRGKASYQAPEMHQKSSYDPMASDLFACGVFAYCLVVAEYPWQCTRPHSPAFAFFATHGLQAFLARRRLKATRLPVETVMSPKLQSLLGILLDPVPERRQKVWTAEPFLEVDVREGSRTLKVN